MRIKRPRDFVRGCSGNFTGLTCAQSAEQFAEYQPDLNINVGGSELKRTSTSFARMLTRKHFHCVVSKCLKLGL